MKEDPSQASGRVIEGAKSPRGGTLMFIFVTLIPISGGAFIAWLSWWIPSTRYFEYKDLAIAATVLVEGIFLLLALYAVLPGYISYAKTARGAVASSTASGERHMRALSGSGLGFWEYDVARKEIYFSAGMMSFLGYGDRERTAGIDEWWKLIHPEDLVGVQRTIEFHLDRRTPIYSIEYRVRKANAEYIWVADHGQAFPDKGGKLTKLSGVTEDISNVKRVQEVLEARTNELEEAKNKIEEEVQNVRKFQKAVDSSTEAVSITTPDGAIVYVNPAWMKLNGYTDTEALGRNPRMLKGDDSKKEVFQAMWEKIVAGYPFATEELINRRKDGTTYYAALSIFPIREGEKNIFYVSLCQDITQRKEVDRAKTEFVSLASHQLRTPLSAIRWYSEMLLSKYVGELNEKQRQYIHEIYQGNLRMVDLVNALLNVSRIDLGTFAIEPEPVSPVEICESVLLELTPAIKQKHHHIDRIFNGAPQTYSADPKLLRIIFQNFLSNSVKYTQEKGTIAAEISTQENNLYIRISDNGYGIPKGQQEKIFEKLFRADNVRQKDTEGTGLGMYIVKAIVESSGGKIWFESEENKGTTFHVYLPLSGMPKKMGQKGLA